jgi:hypothetical protein
MTGLRISLEVRPDNAAAAPCPIIFECNALYLARPSVRLSDGVF